MSIIFLGGIAGSYLYTHLLLPKSEGEITMPGLSGPAKVIRDQWGIPHIEAQDRLDLQRVLGFVIAGDRLFQMDLLRRMVNGQLSEVFGKKTLRYDILFRNLRLRKHMDDFWEKNRHKLDPYMIKLADAFLEGVHYYMETQLLPLEFQLLGYKPRPFRIQELMGISGYMALSFAEGIIADPLFSDLLNQYPREAVDKLRIRHLNDKNIVTEQKAVNYRLNKQWYRDILEAHDFLRDSLGLFHGSNSWVLAGHRSKSGFPLLANDPHVAFSSPGIWYEAHLKAPDYEIYGHFIPGVPFPGMGHNRESAWAVTMAQIDDMDLYLEKFNPQNDNEVMFKNKWVEVKKYEELIKVKGDDDVRTTVVVTPHGPLIDQTKYGVEGKNVALKWSYHHPENNIMTAFYKLSKAKTLAEMKEALSYGGSPLLNVSWADREGNIAWKVLGKIPVRRGFRGHQILEGWSGRHEYARYFTPEENPGLENPRSGLIVTANYYPQYNGPLPIDGYWQPGERLERIHDFLAKQKRWSLEELKTLQTDRYVTTFYWMVPILLQGIDKPEGAIEEQALNQLRRWRGNSDVGSVGSSIYHMWTHYLGKEALLDDLGEERYKAFNKIADFWNFFKTFITRKESPWWDDSGTPDTKETRQDVIRRSFKIAIKKLTERLGSNPSDWRWGRLHTVEYQHPLGKVQPLDYLFNLGPFEAGGGYFQIDNMSTARYDDRFDVKLGPSTRRLIDLKNPNLSWGILPTGNVGHFNSPFYRDQVEMFLAGQYRPQWLDVKDVKTHRFKELRFLPKL